MLNRSHFLVEAEVKLKLKGVEEVQKITVKNLPALCVWRFSDRHSQEIAAVLNWLIETFGNNLDWPDIICITSSPVKEGEDPYPMLAMEISGDEVLKSMILEKEIVWGEEK